MTNGKGPPQAVNIGFTTPRGVKAGDLIPGAKLAARQEKDGWTVEAMIPWMYFGKSPIAGEVWSFDLEAGGKVWNGGEGDWQNPLLWGPMKF